MRTFPCLVLIGAFALASCADDAATPLCAPGESQSCACVTGDPGARPVPAGTFGSRSAATGQLARAWLKARAVLTGGDRWHLISALPNGGFRIVHPSNATAIDFGGGPIGWTGSFVVDLDEDLAHVASFGIGASYTPHLVDTRSRRTARWSWAERSSARTSTSPG